MASAFKDRIPNGMDAVNLAMQAAAGLSSCWVALWLYIARGTPPKFNMDTNNDGLVSIYFLSKTAIFGYLIC